jgi:hypothetical protein
MSSTLPIRKTREQLVVLLRDRGYPISLSTLHKMCMRTRNQGPKPVAYWGKRPLYDPDEAIAWAESRLRPAPRDDQAAA